MKVSLFFLGAVLLAGCAGTGPMGRESLDALRGGMTMDEVVGKLGEPSALVEIRVPGWVYYDLSYIDTVIDPGVVELYFRPTLTEIVIDTELYRGF